MANENVVRICVTPTRNESWIITPFLKAAGMWADHTIVADQRSTDGTPELVGQNPKAILVRNESTVFDENHRQKLLLNRAREIPGRRILVGLDADEALSANFQQSKQWRDLETAPAGSIVRFRWANVLPGFQKVWIQPAFIPFGFIDDGGDHVGRRIHSPRVPQPPHAPIIDIDDVVVLHFQYVLWDRMRSKQRWYQMWEYTVNRQKSLLQIFREYNHMHGSWGPDEITPIRSEWLDGFEAAGVDFRSLKCEPVTWWDREIVQLLREKGPQSLSKLAIWDTDWNEISKRVGPDSRDLRDPRSWWERSVHRMLLATQRHRGNLGVRAFEKLLRSVGW